MLDLDQTFINEEFRAESVAAAQMDKLLANGWRHFGTCFFRYNLGFHEFDIRRVIPLRIRLSDYFPSKSQRRVLRKNTDLRTEVRPVEITTETVELFERHKLRFKRGTPDSIYDFLSKDAANTPGETMEVGVYKNEKLLASSFFDIGETALSGVYAIFDPVEHRRSLGIFTMLKEIEFAVDNGKEFYYQGYCYEGESFYDYKKRFAGTERFDWRGNWEHFTD